MRAKNSNYSRFEKLLVFGNILVALLLALAYLSTYINPNTIGIAPFFGLLYPIFLFVNFIFFVIWLMRRRKIFLLSLITILIGFTHLSHFVQVTFLNRNDDTKKTEIKVMSFNVRLFDLYNWTKNKETRNEIFDFLQAEKPDVVCFQEFYRTNSQRWEFNTRDTLLQLLQTEFLTEGYTVTKRDGEHFGLCTMSKFPIIEDDLVKFDNDLTNSFIYSDMVVASDTIRVYNAHIGSARFELEDYQAIGTEGNHKSWPHKPSEKQQKIVPRLKLAYQKRVQQTKLLMDHVEFSQYPAIVCGDFNDTPVSYNYRLLTANLYDAFTLSANGTGGTYTKLPMIRIDYILHSREFNSFDFVTHSEELSDHRAISATVEF